MDNEKQKISAFVDHLFQNDNIKNEPIVIAENLIINFITKNISVLKQTLTAPQFFPGKPIEETLQLILTELRDRVLNQIKSFLYDYVQNNINFNAVNAIPDGSTIAPDFIKEKFIQYLDIILTHKDARINFNSIINIFKYDVFERYLNEIFARREFAYNELAKVQKVNLKNVQDHIDYLKILLILKNAAYIKIPFTAGATKKNLNLTDLKKVPNLTPKFFELVEEEILKMVPGLNKKIVKMALKANCPQDQTELEESSARFIYIISNRFQEYKHFEKVDRGAESPDKSWFNIAKKNVGFYGYDKRVLEELYRIAGDNNW